MSFEAIIIDWIHLVATTAWIGGLIFINFVFVPIVNQLEPKDRGKANQLLGKYFARVAGVSGFALVLTGLVNLPEGTGWDNLSDTGDYSTFVYLKVLIIVAFFVLGFYAPLKLAPKMLRLAPAPGEKPSPELLATGEQILLIGRINMIIGFVILFFAAVLLNGANF